MDYLNILETLSDDQLQHEAEVVVAADCESAARVIAVLIAVETRRLYLGLGFSCMFTYCRDKLRFSEDIAFNRIEVARAAKRFPVMLERIADGSISLAAARLLSPHLTADNHKSLLTAATHKTKRDVEKMVVKYRPLPPVAATVRKTPTPRVSTDMPVLPKASVGSPLLEAAGSEAAAAPSLDVPRPVVKPLSESTYKLQVTITMTTHDKLRRAQALLRHQIPKGDLAELLDRALDSLLKDVTKKKAALVDRPRLGRPMLSTNSRHIPADVKRTVWTRDDGQCAFRGSEGRCAEIGFLEYHHVVPYADGGKATVENIEMRCRAHNCYEADKVFGPLFAREATPAY